MRYKMKSKQVNIDETINIPDSAICIKVMNINAEARSDEYIIQWLEEIIADPARFAIVHGPNANKTII